METDGFDSPLSAWLSARFASSAEQALSAELARWRGISPQAANQQLRKHVAAGALSVRAQGRRNLYRLTPVRQVSVAYARAEVREDRVWSDDVAPLLAGFASPEAMRVLEFGVTEIVNNAHDHSEGTTVCVRVEVDLAFTCVIVSDDGEGIFARIKRLCGLLDAHESLLELAKGKLTTDPAHHSGEGVFFTSRALDHFEIRSSGLTFSHLHGRKDILFDHASDAVGTTVVMRHAHTSPTRLSAVFDEYAAPDEFTFDKTVVPLRLAVYGNENLMSRSQAKRVLSRVERFRTVLFDFDGVAYVGQGFADEIFRVFANEHPGTELVPINANADIGQMVSRAMRGRGSPAPAGG